MIKIKILGIGKDKDKWLTEGQAHFEKLLSRYAQLAFQFLPSLKLSSSYSINEIKTKEAEHLSKHLSSNRIIALSDSGKNYDSIAFSAYLEKQISLSMSQITFVIGGAYGLDDSILQKADSIISLSPLTFSHQLVRLVLLEQLYRAFSISKNTDYHK